MTVLTEVDCVVVSYNISVRVVVVDNLSSDGSVGTARERGSAVIVNDSNRGFAAAVNQGLQQGSAPWALILNPDAQMASGALGILLRELRQTLLWAVWGYSRAGCHRGSLCSCSVPNFPS